MTFSEDVKRLREQANISQDRLSKILDVSSVTVYRWERGENIPHNKEQVLEKIQRLL